ncbi:MAG: DNA repair protein RecN [Propionibacteriaceae bacterium]
MAPQKGSAVLTELSIRNLGVIDGAVLTPAAGLTVVTGETGAGKTMVVSGLGLVSGAKADASLIRHGAQRAIIEARFTGLNASQHDIVIASGGELEEGELLAARHLVGNRSRAFLGGAGTTNAVLADLVGELVTLHGQSEQIRLGTAERQREVLDRAGGPELLALLEHYHELWSARQQAAAELATLTADAQARARELDLVTFGLHEIEAVDPQPGEDLALAAEAQRLHAADDLRGAATVALAALAGDDDAVTEQPGALGLVGQAKKVLANSCEHDLQLAELATRMTDLSYALGDIAADLSGYLADLDADPARLEAIAARRAALQHLTRKYGTSIDEVLAWAEQAAQRAATLSGSDERIATLRQQLDALNLELRHTAQQLTTHRQEAAKRLEKAVVTELKALALPHARLRFSMEQLAELGPHGAETISLQFSANPGSALGPLAKVASGGELSRVRLGLEVVLAEHDPGQTFIFDEVDAGVGGATATEIGRRLAALATRAQVICVTHLAQVAAFADAHYVVAKASDGQVTTSGIRLVEGAQREEELARMMGGSTSAQGLAYAHELLRDAAAARV